MRTVLILLASLMLAMPVYAQSGGGGEPNNTHCNGVGNVNSPCAPGGDGGGEGGGGGGGSAAVDIDITGTLDVNNSNTNTLDNSNTTTIGDLTGGDSSVVVGDTTLNNDSTSSATGGSVVLEEGANTANGGSAVIEEGANTNTNTASATGGSVEEGAVVVNNNVTVEGQDVPTANSQTVEGDDIDIDARTINEASTVEPAVNSVAPSFSGICNSGAAGQGRGFALSLAVTNDVCQCLMMADAFMAIGEVEEAHTWVRAAARHAKWKGGVGYIRHLVTLGIL